MQIVFTGDTVFTGLFEGQESNENLLTSEVKDFFLQADFCVCDIEGPICSYAKITDRVAIRSQPTIHDFLSSIRANILFLGNNHILDYGTDGLNDTLKFAGERGYRTIGAGLNLKDASEPLMIDSLCGLLSLRYNNKHARATETECGCLIWDEDEIIKDRIKEIKNRCKWCILVIHGGDEFCPMPLPEIRSRYLKFLDWGADIIVGHHPHVVQNYEKVGEKIIFYSLGNFVFDDQYMRVFAEAKKGVVLKLNLTEDGCMWDYLPISIDGDNNLISKCTCPSSFLCVSDERDYEVRLPNLVRDFMKIERMNINFQISRKDISLKAKCRIVLSHIKRYVNEKKTLQRYQ